MTVFLLLAFACSALVIGIAHAMEAGAIRNRVSGANGFVLTMVLVASALASLGVALIAWVLGSFGLGVAVLAFSALWHICAFKLSVARLQGLIDRDTARKADP